MHLPLTEKEEAVALMEYHRGDKCMASCMGRFIPAVSNDPDPLPAPAESGRPVLTITGFSGPKMAATNAAARTLMAIGIVLDLASIIVLLVQGLLSGRWLS